MQDRLYSISDIQDYFEHVIKKYDASLANNVSIKYYFIKTENRITFKIEGEYYLEFLTPENKVTKDKNGENGPKLEVVEVVLVHC